MISACHDTGCRVFNGDSLNNSSIFVPANSPNDKLYDSGIDVEQGKILRTRVMSNGLIAQPSKYRAIVRLDPRFDTPIVFMAAYDYEQDKYIPDWTVINGTFRDRLLGLINYQARESIGVYKGDVINIKIINKSEFFDSKLTTGFSELSGDNTADGIDISSLITSSGNLDNVIIDTYSREGLCAYTSAACGNNSLLISNLMLGISNFQGLDRVEECDLVDLKPLCSRKAGYGLVIKIGGQVVKPGERRFINYTNNSVLNQIYYLHVEDDGVLQFGYMYDTANAVMSTFYESFKEFQYARNIYNSDLDLEQGFSKFKNQIMDKLIFNRYMAGRYLLHLEIGSGTGSVLQDKISNIGKKYVIKSGGEVVHEGEISGDLLEINSPKSGRLYLKIDNPYKDIAGNMVFASQSYTGFSLLSDFLFNTIVQPLKVQMKYLSAILFSQITKNGNFVFALNAILVMYIMFFGFMFAIGSIKVTVNELISRVIKVIIVSTLFSSYSWDIFSNYLFEFFLDGTDQLMNSIANASSQVGNPFGFIDPIISKYLNPDLWFILWNYVGFFGYGYILPAGFIMVGIYYLFRSLISAIMGYIMAFFSLCVVIALAPIFITCLLFERTRTIFDNWINVMFGYVLQPTFVLIFVLFIDQISSDIIEAGIRPVCYDCLLPFGFNVPELGIALDFLCIEGYAPTPLSAPVAEIYRVAALFYCIMRLMVNVVDMSVTMADILAGGGGVDGAVKGGASASVVPAAYNKFEAETWRDYGQPYYNVAKELLKSTGKGAISRIINGRQSEKYGANTTAEKADKVGGVDRSLWGFSSNLEKAAGAGGNAASGAPTAAGASATDPSSSPVDSAGASAADGSASTDAGASATDPSSSPVDSAGATAADGSASTDAGASAADGSASTAAGASATDRSSSPVDSAGATAADGSASTDAGASVTSATDGSGSSAGAKIKDLGKTTRPKVGD